MKNQLKFMNLIFLIIILLLTGSCQEKTSHKDFEKYDPLVWSAMISIEEQNYEDALFLFQKAFKIIPNDNAYHRFNAAYAALNLGKNNIADEQIRIAISSINFEKFHFDNFYGFEEFRTNQLFEDIEKDYELLVNQYYLNLPYPRGIDEEISNMVMKDQNVRNEKKWDEMSRVDSLNINRLIEITNEYGWIDKGFIILWHQRLGYSKDNYVWNHFKPLIEKEIENGRVRKSFWTTFEDDLSIRETKTQIYGIYQYEYTRHPIREVKTVDSLRMEFGLPPLWYESKIEGIELPKGYTTHLKDFKSFKKLYSITY